MEQSDTPAKVASNDGLGLPPERVTFEAYLNTLPAPMQANIRDSMKRDESYSWKLWQAAQAAERERCAQICRDHAADKTPPFKDYEDNYLNGWLDAANECGWAIEGPNV